MEAAVLALVAVLLLDLAVALTLVVLQLQPDGPPEEALAEAEFGNAGIVRKYSDLHGQRAMNALRPGAGAHVKNSSTSACF